VDAAYVALGDEEASQTFIKSIEKVPFVVVQSSNASSADIQSGCVLPSFTLVGTGRTLHEHDGKLSSAKRLLKAPQGRHATQAF
jgi:hypothetical protein